MKIGLTSGCFDLIHTGHLNYLKRCKSFCDKLIVGVDSDQLVKKFKGELRPIIPDNERLELISHIDYVDDAFIVFCLEDLTKRVIENNVDIVFKHEGYKKIDFIFGVDDTNAELVIVPDEDGLRSTTDIINTCKVR